jgi:predicted protein tyrosine phosphatase
MGKIYLITRESFKGDKGKFSYRILSEIEAREYKSDCKTILISIAGSKEKSIEIDKSKYIDVLFLHFEDIDKPVEGYKVMSEDDAREILGFVRKYENEVEQIVINCGAGISRSAGVCAVLMEIYEGDSKIVYDRFLPNALVRRKIIEEFYRYNK